MCNLIQLANSHCRTYSCPEPEAREQWAGEVALVLVDEVRLVVGDAVKSQNPRVLVQIDADPTGLRRAQRFLLAVVPEGEAGPGPVQAPGLSVVAQAAAVVRTFTLHLLVGQADGDLQDGEETRLGIRFVLTATC